MTPRDTGGQERIRSFVAVEFPDAVQDVCAHIQKELATQVRGVSWVKRGNIHLTLKFLGDITSDQKQRIGEVLEEALKPYAPFEVSLGGLGAFPNWRRPRVVWLGITGGADTLRELARTVEQRLEPVGFPRDSRPFRPHLTLGRIRRPTDLRPLERWVERYRKLDLSPIPIGEVVLMKSVLHPQGSIYTPLVRFALSGM